MFATPIRSSDSNLLVKLVAGDSRLACRLARALDQAGGYHVEVVPKRVSELAAAPDGAAIASLLIVQADLTDAADVEALEHLRRVSPATIVLADKLSESAARRLLQLHVTDWLATNCTEAEFVGACEQALRSPKPAAVMNARCTTFVSALGGAGATTLSLAAASLFARRNRGAFAQCCVADLDLQSGALADYLDVSPNLQLGDVAASPDRLDGQLLEVMLSRHASGLAVLASAPKLGETETIGPDIIGRLLDLTSARFKHVIIDLPRHSLSRLDNVLAGTDTLFIVTELSVAGLRKARRLADMVEQTSQISTNGTVIVNKVRWLGRQIGKRHARELLGDRLAGYVGDGTSVAQEAQNRGLLMSQVKRRNRIEADLDSILNRSKKK